MFLKKWCLLLSKRLGIILLFLIITTVFCCCTYAGGVPKYNPKDPNPKPGLYRVGDMNYRRDVLSVVHSQRREHSRKPDIIRDLIVRAVGDLPRVELFARQKVEGWDVWGNEVESDINL